MNHQGFRLRTIALAAVAFSMLLREGATLVSPAVGADPAGKKPENELVPLDPKGIVKLDRVGKRLGNVFLAHDIAKTLRPILPGDDLITHRTIK